MRSEVVRAPLGSRATVTRTARSQSAAVKVMVAGFVPSAALNRLSALDVIVWPSPASVIVTGAFGGMVRTTS